MSADYDNMIGTIPPGFLASADGNYAPNGAQGESLGTGVATGFSPASVGDARSLRDDERQDAALKGGATQADAIVDLGPNNERLEDAKPELVNALRELVRQYRQEGIVARRNEIRRIRQARLFWQGLQYAWWKPNDMNWHLPYENRSNNDRELEDMPRYQFVTNFYQGFGLSFIAVLSQDVPSKEIDEQESEQLNLSVQKGGRQCRIPTPSP